MLVWSHKSLLSREHNREAIYNLVKLMLSILPWTICSRKGRIMLLMDSKLMTSLKIQYRLLVKATPSCKTTCNHTSDKKCRTKWIFLLPMHISNLNIIRAPFSPRISSEILTNQKLQMLRLQQRHLLQLTMCCRDLKEFN